MQGIVEKIFDNKGFVIVAWTIALLIVAALILFIYRLAFGRRLKASGGGRTRLPRLGVVDAFDLDRHRQLVIVRRDNIEHLLMIGGPNDLVVESEIVRAESRELRLRDKDVRDKEFREKESREAPQPSVQAPPAASWPHAEPAVGRAASQPYAPRSMPAAPIAPVPELISEQTALPLDEPAPPPAAPPAPRIPAFPLPPRRAGQPLTPPQRIPREPVSRPDPPMRAEAGAGKAGAFRRTSLATPFLRTSPPRQLSDPTRNAAAPPPPNPSPAGSNQATDATMEPAREASSREETGRNAPARDASRGEAATGGPAPAAEVIPALQEDDSVRPPEPQLPAPLPAEPEPAADLTPPAAPRSMTGSADDGVADELDKARDAKSVAFADAKSAAFVGVKSPAFADDAASSPPDSLDHSLEEEMARLLGRGP